MKKILCILTAAALALSIASVSTFADGLKSDVLTSEEGMLPSAEISGPAGNSATWTFDEATGTLTISGTGSVYKSDNYLMLDESLIPLVKKIVVQPGITSIGSSAFENYVNLTDVSLPEGLEGIYSNVFANCTSLESIDIPEGVEKLSQSFWDCSGLKSIRLPSTLEELTEPFIGCTSLAEITVDPRNENIFAVDNVLFYKYHDYFGDQTSLIFYPLTKTDETYTIPVDITEVGDYAFYEHKNIKYIDFPGTLQRFGDYAFAESTIKKLTLPQGFEVFGDQCCRACADLEEINFPSSVTSMSSWASFASCTSLKKIDLSKTGITSLGGASGYAVFSGCSGVTELILPPQLEKIIDNCFNGVLPGGEIKIPKTVSYIGGGAFENSPNQKLYFLGDAPTISTYSYEEEGYFFDPTDVIYYIPGTSGWTDSVYYDAESGTWAGSKLVAWDGYTAGDVDRNGQITLDDAILTLKHAMNVELDGATFIEDAADINGDGKITIDDAISVLRMAMSVE